MTIILSALAVLVGTGAVVAATHGTQLRKQRRAEEDQRIRVDPQGWVRQQAATRDHELSPLVHERGQFEDEIAKTQKTAEDLGKPQWSGVPLLIRTLALVLLTGLVVVGAILNVEIFVALADGSATAPAVLKGIGASVLEVVLALVLAHLLFHPSSRESLAWKMRVAGIALALGALVVGVAAFAPQRSVQTWEGKVDLDTRLVQLDQSQPTAETAAVDTLASDRAREHRAEESDVAQALAFPIGESLTAGLGLEGALAVAVMVRRKALVLTLKEKTAKYHRLDRRIGTRRDQFVRDVTQRLFDLGIIDLTQRAGARPLEPGGEVRTDPLAGTGTLWITPTGGSIGDEPPRNGPVPEPSQPTPASPPPASSASSPDPGGAAGPPPPDTTGRIDLGFFPPPGAADPPTRPSARWGINR